MYLIQKSVLWQECPCGVETSSLCELTHLMRRSNNLACDQVNICLLQKQVQQCKHTWTCQRVSSHPPYFPLQVEDGPPLSLQHVIPKIFSKSTITAQQGITMPVIQSCCQAQRASHKTHGKVRGSNDPRCRYTSRLYVPKQTLWIVAFHSFLSE